MKISIIIPTRNRAQNLKTLLEKISEQTVPSEQYEVLVIDNGSEDDTKAVCQEYKKILPNGVIIEPETKILAVNSDWLVYSAVNAVKELDKSIQQLEIDLKAYIKDFLGLKSRVAKLEKQASQLRQQNSMIKARLEKLK